VGRKDLLRRLELDFPVALEASPHPKRFVLQALGGQGKSQFALELCRRLKSTGQFKGIFWINAMTETTATRSLENIAAKINTSISHALPHDVSRRAYVRQTLENWEEPWLLVFDNYDRPEAFVDIGEFFPLSELQNVKRLDIS
jgi:hypothetical protein